MSEQLRVNSDFMRRYVGDNPGVTYSDAVSAAPFRDANKILDDLIRQDEILLSYNNRLSPNPEYYS
jgi:hypothetical protein